MSSGWIILLSIMAFLAVLMLWVIYKVKCYLDRSGAQIQDTLGEVGEEIESYQEKTQ